MAVSYLCGWELGDASAEATATGTVSVQSTTVHEGYYSARVNPAGATASHFAFKSRAAGGTLRTLFQSVRLYVRVDTLPSAGNTIELLQVLVSGAAKQRLRINSSGALICVNAAGTAGTASSTTMTTGAWHRIEFDCGYSSGSDVRVFLDGTSVASVTGTVSQGDELRVGQNNAIACDLYLDDMVVEDAALSGGAQTADWRVTFSRVIGTYFDSSFTHDGGFIHGGTSGPLWEQLNNTPPTGLAYTNSGGSIWNDTTTIGVGYQWAESYQSAGALQQTATYYCIGGSDPAEGFERKLGVVSELGVIRYREATGYSVRATSRLSGVSVRMKRTSGNAPPYGVYVELHKDNNGDASWNNTITSLTHIADTATVAPGDIPTAISWVRFDFASVQVLDPGIYWLVVRFVTDTTTSDGVTIYWGTSAMQAITQPSNVLGPPPRYWASDSTWHVDGSDGRAPEGLKIQLHTDRADVIKAIAAFANHAEGDGPQTKAGKIGFLNPTETTYTFDYGDDSGAAGTYPTNWRPALGPVLTSGIDATQSPCVEFQKTTSTTRIAMFDAMGVYVWSIPTDATSNPASSPPLRLRPRGDSLGSGPGRLWPPPPARQSSGPRLHPAYW